MFEYPVVGRAGALLGSAGIVPESRTFVSPLWLTKALAFLDGRSYFSLPEGREKYTPRLRFLDTKRAGALLGGTSKSLHAIYWSPREESNLD